MDILFLGGLFPKELEKEIIENSMGNIQNAANNLQWEIVSGLDAANEKPVKIINSLYIGSYPKRYKKLIIRTSRFGHGGENNQNDINVGFLNLSGVKNLSRYVEVKKHIKKWATESSDDKKVVIAYAMTSTFTRSLKYIKRFNPEVVTCLIVPDLPEYMNMSKKNHIIYNFFKNIEIKLMKSDKKYIDSFVLLTQYMKDALEIKVPYVVIEGIATELFTNIEKHEVETKIKTIVYSGGLNEKYGVSSLLEAFGKIGNPDCRLILCGAGDAENQIIEASKKDNRIIFKGMVERQTVLELQKNATILVNPRQNNEEFTKYSFPSKILEYMSSGRPVLAYKLDGIPNEYYEYLYIIDENDDGLYNSLKDILEKTEQELDAKGKCAKEFVLNKKNGKVQAEKILEMVKN